ncbi:hypothetical protein ACFQ0Q_38425 [Streptomyces aureus]
MHPLHPGDPARIGGYTLLGRLGSGGMGTVFLARTAGGRVVALKTVREELAREPEFRIRFRLEAEAARAIGARHGAAVVDADTQGTVPWLATSICSAPPSTRRCNGTARCPNRSSAPSAPGSRTRSPRSTAPAWCTATSNRRTS